MWLSESIFDRGKVQPATLRVVHVGAEVRILRLQGHTHTRTPADANANIGTACAHARLGLRSRRLTQGSACAQDGSRKARPALYGWSPRGSLLGPEEKGHDNNSSHDCNSSSHDRVAVRFTIVVMTLIV